MSNERLAILYGYNEYANGYDGKKVFKPCRIIFTAYSNIRAKYELEKIRKEAKSQNISYTYKIVKADKYKEFLNKYDFSEWLKFIIEEIDFHFKDLDKEYRNALKSGIRHINFNGQSREEIMSLTVKDIIYTTSAKESISAYCHTSTWSFNVKGMFGKFPFEGTSYDVSRL